MLLEYYGNLELKNYLTEKNRSLDVVESSWTKLGSLFMLYPVPAGESMKSRLVMLLQPKGFNERGSSGLYSWASLRQ